MNKTGQEQGVSIIACTKRPEYMMNLLTNYSRQRYPYTELIVILNNDSMNLSYYQMIARRFAHVRVYQLPEKTSLGSCLNFGVAQSRLGYIAKFDDDDYYAADYLMDSLSAMRRTKADIVGKRAHYMYLEGHNVLLLRYPPSENRYVPIIQGATLLVKREVFQKVIFRNRSLGECVRFCADTRAKGFKIYACDRFNFVAIRRKDAKDHTWTVSDKRLMSGNVRSFKVKDYKAFVTRDRAHSVRSPNPVPLPPPYSNLVYGLNYAIKK